MKYTIMKCLKNVKEIQCCAYVVVKNTFVLELNF